LVGLMLLRWWRNFCNLVGPCGQTMKMSSTYLIYMLLHNINFYQSFFPEELSMWWTGRGKWKLFICALMNIMTAEEYRNVVYSIPVCFSTFSAALFLYELIKD
jgi:hypothetical protein